MWFERRYWQNSDCDNEFRRSKDYQEGKVCMLKPPVVNEVKMEDVQKKNEQKNKWADCRKKTRSNQQTRIDHDTF